MFLDYIIIIYYWLFLIWKPRFPNKLINESPLVKITYFASSLSLSLPLSLSLSKSSLFFPLNQTSFFFSSVFGLLISILFKWERGCNSRNRHPGSANATFIEIFGTLGREHSPLYHVEIANNSECPVRYPLNTTFVIREFNALNYQSFTKKYLKKYNVC